MKVLAIDFVASHVSDMDRARGFYRDVLGITEDLIFDKEDWVEFDTDPVALAFDGGGAPDGLPQTVIGLAVEDVPSAVEELREQGVEIVMEALETDVCTVAYIRDPDGNLLALHRRHDGTAG